MKYIQKRWDMYFAERHQATESGGSETVANDIDWNQNFDTLQEGWSIYNTSFDE
jgi:hypothetical protein